MTDDPNDPSKLNDLGERLRVAQSREQQKVGRVDAPDGKGNTGMGLGFRIAVELVAGIAVGVLIGLALDVWLGTRPWLMVVFLFLGAAAGVMNVYRAAKGIDQSVGLGEAQRRRDQDRTNGL